MDSRLTAFVAELRRILGEPRLYLFGSRARGEQHEDSDYDLIIVSEEFAKTDFVNRAGTIWMKTREVIPADLLCYTPEEFASISKTSVIVRDALKDAVPL